MNWRIKRLREEQHSEGDFNGGEKSSAWQCDEPVMSWRLKRWIEEMHSEGDFNGTEKRSVWHCDELET
jgi:hypothetical protein